MLGLFEPRHRRVKDEREVRYFYTKYGANAPTVLCDWASDDALSSRDRHHWRRLARKARLQKEKWAEESQAG